MVFISIRKKKPSHLLLHINKTTLVGRKETEIDILFCVDRKLYSLLETKFFVSLIEITCPADLIFLL